jgi:hypothetical protein
MQGLGSMMMGGSAADGAPQPGAQGIDLGMLLAQMLKGGQMPQGQSPLGGAMGQPQPQAQQGGGGMKMPLFANGPLGQALGSQGLPMGILGLLGRQLGK